jgi:hypothetical protein
MKRDPACIFINFSKKRHLECEAGCGLVPKTQDNPGLRFPREQLIAVGQDIDVGRTVSQVAGNLL